MKSKMFLNDVTVIDCAYVDNKGMLIGDSISPKFIVSGEVDENENVVVDFSSIKKDIKGIIDAKYSGFDHKLWVIDGYSNYTLMSDWGNLEVITPYFKINAPRDAFKIIPNRCGEDYLGSVMEQMVFEIGSELNLKYPKTNIKVELEFSDEFVGNGDLSVSKVPFRYIHGLKCSTSWGCQNIAHGHLSFLSARAKETANLREVEMLLHTIAQDIDNTIFVWDENIAPNSSIENVNIEYETARGYFRMEIEGSYAASRVIVLPTETTVELLANAIAKAYNEQLKEVGVIDLFVSEGLNKGALVNI